MKLILDIEAGDLNEQLKAATLALRYLTKPGNVCGVKVSDYYYSVIRNQNSVRVYPVDRAILNADRYLHEGD